MDALRSAIACLGGVVRSAAALGISQSAVSNWLTRKVERIDLEHCVVFETETRRIAAERGDPSLIVTVEDLRPDVDVSVLRQNPTPTLPKEQQ